MVYMLDRAASYLLKVPALGADFRQTGHAPGSTAARLEAMEGDVGSFADAAVKFGLQQLAVVEDHLATLGRIVADQMCVYSTYTVSRTAAEIGARAGWLLEVDLSDKDRTARFVAARMYSEKEQGNLAIRGVKEKTGAKRKELRERASSARLNLPSYPGAAKLLSEMFSHEQDERIGATMYQLHSAFTHGTLYAIMAMVHELDRESERVITGQVRTDAATEAQTVLLAFIPYMSAMRAATELYGQPWQRLAFLPYLSAEVRRVMEGTSSPT